ncbi:hypothetical protein [Myroides injenensis]|uniref:hypothetical protein n=1 Tax=Myroides injenensis TaxID=1183151 RepID=UPI00028885AC|nr:hypothetical protein [Myroides injenensis]
MKHLLIPVLLLVSYFCLTSCQTTETIVSSPYLLNKEKATVFSAKTFLFKNYFFTFKNGQATLIYQQDKKLNKDAQPVFLPLVENKNAKKYQEFTDAKNQIVVKIINDHEVRLQLDKARYTLYTSKFLEEVNADTEKILADIAIWRDAKY